MSGARTGGGRFGWIFEAAQRVYALPLPVVWTIAWFPVVTSVAFEVMLAVPATHAFALRLLGEDRMVENFTVAGYLIAAVLSFVRAARAMRRKESVWWVWGSVALGLVCFVLGMEEISWGERWLHFRIPDLLLRHNVQEEFTVHNLEPLQDLNWWYPLILASLGAIAILRHTRPRRDETGVPSVLLPYCLVLILFSGYDNLTDWFPINLRVDIIVGELTELVEMLVAFAFAIGIALALRRDVVRAATPPSA